MKIRMLLRKWFGGSIPMPPCDTADPHQKIEDGRSEEFEITETQKFSAIPGGMVVERTLFYRSGPKIQTRNNGDWLGSFEHGVLRAGIALSGSIFVAGFLIEKFNIVMPHFGESTTVVGMTIGGLIAFAWPRRP